MPCTAAQVLESLYRKNNACHVDRTRYCGVGSGVLKQLLTKLVRTQKREQSICHAALTPVSVSNEMCQNFTVFFGLGRWNHAQLLG